MREFEIREFVDSNNVVMDRNNLNTQRYVDVGDGSEKYALKDPSITEGDTKVYFSNIKQHLINHIREADIVLGAVAWLSDFDVLDELAKKDHVMIVVQKEDFLRPDPNFDEGGDGEKKEDFKTILRRKYNALNVCLETVNFDGVLFSCNWARTHIQPVTCLGNHNADKAPAAPRMHNKFMLFAKMGRDEYREMIVPHAVWTGSYNVSKNAVNSLENAIVLQDENVVEAYYQEFQNIFSMSENLDWTSKWCTSDYRIGT